MIIDIHTHIFPEEMCRNREKFFSGEPAFKLLYESPKSKMASAEDLNEMMETEGVDFSVTFGFPWKNPDFYRLNNDYVIETVKKYENIKGFACFDTENPDVYDETVRCIEAGLCGVGELAFYTSGIDDKALDQLAPVMEICAEQDLPVMIHTNESVGHYYTGKTPITHTQIYEMAKRFPDNRIVMCHYGGGIFFFNLLKKEVKEVMKNVYYDTAASPFLFDKDIYRVSADLAGRDRIILGTDYPLLKPSRYIKEMENIGLDKGIMDDIVSNNAGKLLKL